MIISEEIRLIPEFTGQTSASTEQSDLKLVSGYLVYTSSFGGNLVDEFTVRDFLDNSNNEQLATDFFNYLQSNYSIPDFNELYYNNLKLANVLNDYYGRTVVSNLSPTKTVANLQLTATTAITYTNTNFIDYNKRSDKKITVIVGYNTGDSYYINVPINRNYNLVDNQNYDKYRKNSIGNLVTKEVAEEFRYVIKKGDIIPNTDMIIKTNSFNDYNPRLPIGLNIPQIKIQFKTDRYIIPKNSNLTNIPIDIVFDKPAQFTGQTFALKIDYAEATNPPLLGSEIALVDGQNNSLISQNILINYGQSAYTANLIIKNPAILLMPDFVVRLNLGYNVSENIRSYSVSDDSFFVVNEQSPQIISEVNSSIDFVSKKTKTSPQVFLQSFVDLNYDDNESAFWLNPATTGFPEGFIVATPPVQPPPPAPHTGVTISNTPVDLTKNYLYNAMKNLGYHLISREGFGKSVVVMQGGGGVTTHLGGSNFGGQNPKIGQFYIYGYNLIRFDTSDIGETARIYGILKDFFDPYPL